MNNKCNKMLLLGALLGLVTLGQSVKGGELPPKFYERLAKMSITALQNRLVGVSDAMQKVVKKMQNNPKKKAVVKNQAKQYALFLQTAQALHNQLNVKLAEAFAQAQ